MRTPEGAEATQREICITQPFLPGITVGGVPLGHEAFIRQYMSTLTAGFVSYIRSTIHQLQPGLVCSCSEFSEMLVSYLGVDSPAASSPGVLGASFSGYSGGRQRFVVDAGGWEVERVQMPGDGWRDAHDYIASTVFDLVSLAGITGTMEPRGIFSMAVPAEVLATALAEDGGRPCTG